MNVLRNTIFKNLKRCLTIARNSSRIYEPTYLEEMKSKIPLYDVINIHLKGYDYPILENYQKLVHNVLKNLDFDVEDCWAVPGQHMQILTFKPKSEIVNSQYNLKIYERTVQITDISSVQLPLVIRMIETSLPPGITAHIRKHEDSDEEVRYIPDSDLITLKQELEELGGPSKSQR